MLESVKSQAILPVRLLAHFLGLFRKTLGKVVRLITRSLYSCLHPAYFSQECLSYITSLSDSAWEELRFWETTISKPIGFEISPITPSITTCEVMASVVSGKDLCAAQFFQI